MIKLGCEMTTSSGIRWKFYSPQRQLPVLLYSGYRVNSSVAWRVSVNVTADWNELTVHNVTSEDTGVYSCQEIGKFPESVRFSVTVKGTLISKLLLVYSINVLREIRTNYWLHDKIEICCCSRIDLLCVPDSLVLLF